MPPRPGARLLTRCGVRSPLVHVTSWQNVGNGHFSQGLGQGGLRELTDGLGSGENI